MAKYKEVEVEIAQAVPELYGAEKPEKMDVKVVYYANKMNEIAFKEFSLFEMRIFMTVLGSVKDKGSKEMIFKFSDLKELLGEDSRHVTLDELNLALSAIMKHLGSINVLTDDGETERIFSIFNNLERCASKQTFKVQVNPVFLNFVNNLSIKYTYTAVNLQEFNGLKSKYSQTLYRLLSQWIPRKDQKCFIDIAKLKRVFMAEDIATKKFNQKMLGPAIKELNKTKEFKRLRIDKALMRGQRPVERVYFRWDRLKEGEDDV